MSFEQPVGDGGWLSEPATPLQVALAALRSDAILWEEVGDGLARCAAEVDSLGVEQKAFTFAGDEVAGRYADVRGLLRWFLVAGVVVTFDTAQTLRAVHDTYQGADERAKDALEDEWDWK